MLTASLSHWVITRPGVTSRLAWPVALLENQVVDCEGPWLPHGRVKRVGPESRGYLANRSISGKFDRLYTRLARSLELRIVSARPFQ